MSEPIIVCEALSKTFRTDAEELRILRSIDLSVEAGATASITGPSGCGKTTLLSILGGLDSPGGRGAGGSLDLHELGEEGLSEYRSAYVGFVFQFHYLLEGFYGPGERSPAGACGGVEGRSLLTGGLSPRGPGARGQEEPVSRQALRRRAAEGGDSPGPCQPARRDPGG
ncbi:MAG: ATP-binding cassette domain-containing protein [Bacillus subtilis]|nr:ATP-binding cassette domain-containing protein [Bacillus subtilis]